MIVFARIEILFHVPVSTASVRSFPRVGHGVGQAGFPHLAAKSNRKVDSLFLRKKPRRLRQSTGLSPRAAFRIHLRLKSKNSDHPDGCSEFLVGEGGFEPPKSLTTDLQSAPFGHSGIPPYSVRCAAERLELVDGLEPPTC